MEIEEASKLDYLSNVFSKLSTEKQDIVLKAARSLVKIQDNDIPSIKTKETCSNEAGKESIK
jgi:hypothetical protein